MRTCSLASGTCSATSETTTVAYGSSGVFVQGTTLYIAQTSTPSLAKCTVGSCTSLVDMMPGAHKTASIVADSANVYFGEGTGGTKIFTCPASGCGGGGATLLAGAEIQPTNLKLDGNHLFWAAVGSAVRWCTLPACVASPLATANAYALAQDATALYYSDGPNVLKIAKP